MGKQENQWQEKEYVLGRFGKERSKAIRAYRKFIEEGIAQGRRLELTGGGIVRSMGGWSRVLALRNTGERAEHDARVLGGGNFVAGILSEAEKNLKRQMRNRKDGDTIDGIIRTRCKEAKIREEELKAGGKRREVTKVRGEIAYRLSRESLDYRWRRLRGSWESAPRQSGWQWGFFRKFFWKNQKFPD